MHQLGKLDNISQEMDRIGFSMLGLAETRWTGKGKNLITTGDKASDKLMI